MLRAKGVTLIELLIVVSNNTERI
ncbi:MAG: prepilin-type N-terminal cleavage/methylation domain-containing protein [Planctomycetota bacterium]